MFVQQQYPFIMLLQFQPEPLLPAQEEDDKHLGGGGGGGGAGDGGGGGGGDGDGTRPPPHSQHMVVEEKSVSS